MHDSIKIGWHTFERKVFFVITHSKKQGELIFKGGPIYFFGGYGASLAPRPHKRKLI